MAPSPEMASKSWFCLCCIIVWTTLRLCWCAWLCLSQTAGWKPEVRAVIVIIYSRVPYSSLLEFSYFGRSWQPRIEQSFLGGAFHFQFSRVSLEEFLVTSRGKCHIAVPICHVAFGLKVQQTLQLQSKHSCRFHNSCRVWSLAFRMI